MILSATASPGSEPRRDESNGARWIFKAFAPHAVGTRSGGGTERDPFGGEQSYNVGGS